MEPISLSQGLRGPILRLQSDERLARLAAAGNGLAFEVLARRHRPALVRAAGRILSGGEAEDAAQQALINAQQALRRNGSPERFQPWLNRIAVNAALKQLRGAPDELPLDEDRMDGVEQPPESLERRERLQRTIGAIGALPDRQRRALVLRELEGRSHGEIARDLGLTAGAVRQLIHRARTAVRSAATALTPYGILYRLAADPEASTRTAEAVAGGGAAAFAAKTVAAGLVAGGIATGVALAPEKDKSGAAGGKPGNPGPALAPVLGDGPGSPSADEDDSSGPGGGEEGRRDSSGPGSGGEAEKADSSGPGPGSDDPDSSGPGGGGGSGSAGSGSSGSGSSGSGSSGSDSSGSGSSGSGGDPD